MQEKPACSRRSVRGGSSRACKHPALHKEFSPSLMEEPHTVPSAVPLLRIVNTNGNLRRFASDRRGTRGGGAAAGRASHPRGAHDRWRRAVSHCWWTVCRVPLAPAASAASSRIRADVRLLQRAAPWRAAPPSPPRLRMPLSLPLQGTPLCFLWLVPPTLLPATVLQLRAQQVAVPMIDGAPSSVGTMPVVTGHSQSLLGS